MLATRSTRSTFNISRILPGTLVATTLLSATLLLTACDDDDDNGTHVPQVATITLVAPAGGEIWGAVRTISWQVEHVTTETVDIHLSSDSGVTYAATLATGVQTDSTYGWDTNLHTDGTTYRIRVSLMDGTGAVLASDASGQDFILDNTGARIVIRPQSCVE